MADILAASAQPDPKQKAATEPVAGLPADLVERMRVDTLAWQAVGGLLIGADASITPAPCSLLPYPWPAELFAQAQALAVPFNSMVDRIARDTDWLHNATRSVGATDQFTSRLLALSEAVHATGASQAWQLGIFRSDYMIHQRTPADAPRLVQVRRHSTPTPASGATHACPFPNNPRPFRLQIQRMATYSRPPPSPPTLSSDPSSSFSPPLPSLQVELNTISASFGSLSRKLSDMHAHLLPRWTTAPMCSSDAHTLRGWSPAIAGAIDSPGDKLPRNGCEEGIAGALAAAHAKYLEQTGGGGGAQGGGEVGCGGGEGGATLPAAVLMVVQPAERNVTDQRGIESCLWAKHKVRNTPPRPMLPLSLLSLLPILSPAPPRPFKLPILQPPPLPSLARDPPPPLHRKVPLVRMSMAEVAAHASLHGPTRRIRFTHRGFEASVVYFRAGYTPNDYPTEAEWQGREMLEMSFAIKCPSVGMSGTPSK